MSTEELLSLINSVVPMPEHNDTWLLPTQIGFYVFAGAVMILLVVIPLIRNRVNAKNVHSDSEEDEDSSFFGVRFFFACISLGVAALGLLALPAISEEDRKESLKLYQENVTGVISKHASELDGAIIFENTPVDYFIKQDNRYACRGTVVAEDGEHYTFDFSNYSCTDYNSRGVTFTGVWYDGLPDLGIEEGWLHWSISKENSST